MAVKLRPREVRVLEMFRRGLTREQVLADTGLKKESLNVIMYEIRTVTGEDIPGHGARIRRSFGSAPRAIGAALRDEKTAARDAAFVALFERGLTRGEVQRELGLSAVAMQSRLTAVRKRRGGDLPGEAADRRVPKERKPRGQTRASLELRRLDRFAAIARMFAEGATRDDVAAAMGVRRATLEQYLLPQVRAVHGDLAGHGALMLSMAKTSRKNLSWVAGDSETRAEADERVRRDVTAGLRCSRCHLFLPCFHEQISEAAHLKRGAAGTVVNVLI